MTLSAASIVLRGGLSTVETMRDNAELTLELENVWGVSAFADSTMSAQDLAIAADVKHKKYRSCTVADLEAEGFVVKETPPPPFHVTILLGDQADETALARLASVLGPVVTKEGEVVSP